MARTPWYYQLSPDSFSRYFLLKEIHKKVFAKKSIKILEVGGKESTFWAFLNDDRLPYSLTVMDIQPGDNQTRHYHYIQGDATQMSFPDNSFDSVVSTDVLEHIPEKRRKNFILECLRVAQDMVIIAAPFDSPLTDQAEHAVNDLYKLHTGQDYVWLKEHFELHKPTRQLMEKILAETKAQYLLFESNSLANWIQFLSLNLLAINNDVNAQLTEKINCFFNEHLLEINDFSQPAYRQFYVIFKNPKLKRSFDQLIKLKPDSQYDIEFRRMVVDVVGEKLMKLQELFLMPEDEKERVTLLKEKNRLLAKDIAQLEQDVHHLHLQYQQYTSSHFFLVWQLYKNIKSLF